MKVLLALLALPVLAATSYFILRGTKAPLPDVVIIVLDDVAASDLDFIPTPRLDAIAAQGVTFTRAYTHAWCAPTRDSLMLGRWLGAAHGDACASSPAPSSLDFGSTLTLADHFKAAGYATAHFGKWHLGRGVSGEWQETPADAGFNVWRWTRPVGPGCVLGAMGAEYAIVNDGEVSLTELDDSIGNRDAFLEWWEENEGTPRFVVVNLFAAHWPFRYPHWSIVPFGYKMPRPGTNRQRFEAEVVGADTVIGHMIDEIPMDAWVFILGDNGTPGAVQGSLTQDATRPDQDPERVKLTCYEEGIHVPFIVRSPQLTGGSVSDALVSPVDVYSTCAKLLGAPPGDGQNLAAPTREYAFSWFGDGSTTAVVSDQWKLMEVDGGEVLFDLYADPDEESPLPPEGPWADKLRGWRSAIMGG